METQKPIDTTFTIAGLEDVPVIDLGAELAEPTEKVNKVFADMDESSIRNSYNLSDFKPEVQETQSTATEFFDDEAPKEPVPVRDGHFYRSEAKRITRLLDKGLRMIIPPVYKSTVLEKGDIEALRKHQVRTKVNKDSNVYEDYSEDEGLMALLDRYERLDDMVKKVGLTKDEMDDLEDDLTEVLKLRQKSFFSPEVSLLITVAVIVFARLEPVVSTKFGQLFKKVKV